MDFDPGGITFDILPFEIKTFIVWFAWSNTSTCGRRAGARTTRAALVERLVEVAAFRALHAGGTAGVEAGHDHVEGRATGRAATRTPFSVAIPTPPVEAVVDEDLCRVQVSGWRGSRCRRCPTGRTWRTAAGCRWPRLTVRMPPRKPARGRPVARGGRRAGPTTARPSRIPKGACPARPRPRPPQWNADAAIADDLVTAPAPGPGRPGPRRSRRTERTMRRSFSSRRWV